MDSSSLQALGIGFWREFSFSNEQELIEHLPALPGVYVVLLPSAHGRRRGASDIAYIGKATNQQGLRGRIRQYFHPGPTQRTNIAMNQRLRSSLPLRLGCIAVPSAKDATRVESELLLKFEAQHGELPPFNRQRALNLSSE